MCAKLAKIDCDGYKTHHGAYGESLLSVSGMLWSLFTFLQLNQYKQQNFCDLSLR